MSGEGGKYVSYDSNRVTGNVGDEMSTRSGLINGVTDVDSAAHCDPQDCIHGGKDILAIVLTE